MAFYFRNAALASIIIFTLTTTYALADRNSDVESLFNWAEVEYPELFPNSASTAAIDVWRYRYYPETGNYTGVNDQNEVWVLGDVFGGMSYIGPLSEMLTVVNSESDAESGQIIDSEDISYNIYQSPGVWRTENKFRFASSDSFDLGSGPVTYNSDSTNRVVDLMLVQQDSTGAFVNSFCNITDLETESDDYIEDDLDEDFAEDDIDYSSCGGVEMNSYKISDNEYLTETCSDGINIGTITYKRKSNASSYGQGNLTFTSSQTGGNVTTGEVCGLFQESKNTTVSSGGQNPGTEIFISSKIDVIGTYPWGRIMFNFYFHKETIEVGTYNVARVSELDGSSVDVDVASDSSLFGGSVEDIEYVRIETGEVTINSISAHSASGYFDLVTRDGESFSGDFSINL